MSTAKAVFSPAERTALIAIAEAIVPPGGAFPLGAQEADVAGVLETELAGLEPAFQERVRWLIRAWEWGHALKPPFCRFSKLPLEQRIARLSRAYQSHALVPRLLTEALKQLCGFAYAASEPFVEAMHAHGCLSAAPPRSGARLHPRQYPEIRGDVEVSADVCVVGSGAGGAVIAAECARAGLRVVVIEEGGYYTREDFDAPPFRRLLRMYRDHGAVMALGNPPIPIPIGKTVGGTTVVNSGTCFRAPAHVLRLWQRQYGLDGFDAPSLEPYFERVERILHVQPVPWEIIGKNAEVFDRGVRALGLHGEPLRRNIRGCRGCGVCAFGCPSDAKQAMHLTYLPLAEAAGATIYARCQVRHLQAEGSRITGVEAAILGPDSDPGVHGRLRIRAAYTVLACGALHTPGLLHRSGIAHTSKLVGKNLALHPALGVSASFPEPLYHWRGTLQSYFVDNLLLSDGVMIEVTTIHPAMAISGAKAVGPELKEFLADLPFRASAGLFVSDTSHGEVRCLPGSRHSIVRYDLSRSDMARLLRGMALVAEIFLASGANVVHTNLPGLPHIRGSRDLGQLRDCSRWKPSNLHLAAFHPVGTCRMGPDPVRAVVGLDGRVHGTEGLFVADGSLFPTCVTVNPQETIMAFATKIAAGIAGRLSPSPAAET